jgi:uncharacterized protein DUF3347
MKKVVLLIIVLLVAGLLAYRLFSGKEVKPAEKNDQPLAIGKNTSVFNVAFAGFLNDYFSMRDALADWDTLKADQAAYALARKADSLPLKQLKADSSIILTAQSLVASVSSEARGFVGEAGIAERRKDFNMLTDEVYNLVRAVRYDGEVIYHDRCPMAFNDSEEGFWLSNSPRIVNPYLGNKHPVYKNKMLGCGEVVDSVDLTK